MVKGEVQRRLVLLRQLVTFVDVDHVFVLGTEQEGVEIGRCRDRLAQDFVISRRHLLRNHESGLALAQTQRSDEQSMIELLAVGEGRFEGDGHLIEYATLADKMLDRVRPHIGYFVLHEFS